MYKLDRLSIFLILLFIMVFAIVLNHYWETMWNNIEGFESKRKLELLYDNVYFDPLDKKLYEKNGDAIESSKFVKQDETNEKVDFYKNGDKMYLLYFPEEKSTFIHIFDMKENKQLCSKFYQGKNKIETVYDDTNNIIKPKLGVITDLEVGLLFDSPYEDLEVVMYKLQVQTQTQVKQQTDKPMYCFGLKYLGIRYLLVFQEEANGKINILKQETSNRPDYDYDWSNGPNGPNGHNGPNGPNGPIFNDKIEIKFGNNEIKINPQDALQLGSAFLGGYSMEGNPFMMGAPFMKPNDYNKDYIRKTEVVPGFGYDYYYNPDHGPVRSTGESTGSKASSTNTKTSTTTTSESGATKVGVETVGVARDAVQGATSIARDTVSGATSLAKDTVGGATNLARETVGGATSLAKDTVGGATSLAKDTVGGATNLAKDTVGGATNAIGSTLSGTGNFIQSSASGIGSFVKDAAGGTVGLVKDAAGGTIGLVKDTASGTIGLGREIIGGVGGIGGGNNSSYNNNSGYNSQGYYNSYGGPGVRNNNNNNNNAMDQYSYNGAVPPRPSCNFIPRTADFSAFRR